jgi:hypothetical protein
LTESRIQLIFKFVCLQFPTVDCIVLFAFRAVCVGHNLGSASLLMIIRTALVKQRLVTLLSAFGRSMMDSSRPD